MKKILFILLALYTFTAHAQVTKATLQASGLTCALCSKAVYKALTAVPFVKDVHPNIQQSTYEINFKPGQTVDFDALGRAVVNAGFSVSMLKITDHFNAVKVENDAHVVINQQTFHFLNVPAQTLQGDKTITLVDKNFVTTREYKKYGKFTSMKCYETGMMGACCKNEADKNSAGTGTRVYHVTI